ncbi:MAG: LacI family DNA-binding transcriptional regulator [Opitutaceae bacterium]|nr:LacI family DNA-binding transcriptional regulator [Opitutaceae bacterium]
MSLNKIGKPIVTQKMLADAVGVHLSTVSLALRNDPRIPQGTRRRVQSAARKLGYTPNPLVSLLLSRVRRRNAAYRGTLGYLHTVPESTPRLAGRVHRNYIEGARRRASELGYNLDEFFLDPSLPNRRLLEMLHTRNIMGLVVEHMPSALCPNRCLPFDISPFASASLGVPLASPQIHYVANDQYMRAVVAAREVLALGYRRLGLVMDEHFDSAMAHRCSAGFWAVQEYAKGTASIPICRIHRDKPDALLRWLRKHRPDVVFGTHQTIHSLLQLYRKTSSADIGWVHLDWMPEHRNTSGVHGNSDHIGAAAVELVVSQLHRGESGPPARAMNYFVSGTWHPGRTVHRVGPPLDLDAAFFSDLLRVTS